MKLASLRLFIIFAGSVGLVAYALAGPAAVSPSATGSNTEPVISSAGSPSNSNFGTQTAPTNTSPDSTSSSENNAGSSSSQDDQSNDLGKDADGMPILKRKPGAEHERIIELKDGQKLPTSGVDPKFQGSLLNTSVDSIESIALETNKDRGVGNQDPRFKTKNLSLTKDSADMPKKSEPVSARSNENPSPTPTPSATASPTAKVSSERAP